MKKQTPLSFITLLFLLFPIIIFSQNFDYSKIDEFARNVPGSKANSIDGLAEHLTKKYNTEREKTRAIFIWMTENIKYNYRVLNNDNISIQQRLKKEKPERVLKAKWAVCEGYSNLFNALCNAANIGSEVVSGKVKDHSGKIPKIGHAWNVVKVDGQWYPIDVTWSAGGLSDKNGKYVKSFKDDYFLASPAYFIQDHFPSDPVFQLTENPIPFSVFKNNKKIELKKYAEVEINFQNITDSLNYHHQLNRPEKKIKSCERILRFDENNSYANFNIAKFHYEQAKPIWEIYQTESKKVFNKKEKLTWEKIEKWERIIEQFRNKLKETEKYLSKIPINDQYAFNKKTIMHSLKQNKEIDGQINKQFSEFKRYLEATGVERN